MVNAGAAALLIEGAAAEVSQIITEQTELPVISCGSGPACDGQVLVAPDILGLTEGKLPKFSKAYTQMGPLSVESFRTYAKEVKARQFPDHEHSYHMKPGELQRLTELLDHKS
jgi:3-methyl-2-oxobutanoate hydroxymethyltransferase